MVISFRDTHRAVLAAHPADHEKCPTCHGVGYIDDGTDGHWCRDCAGLRLVLRSQADDIAEREASR